jgi:uncharacterized protein DUF3455
MSPFSRDFRLTQYGENFVRRVSMSLKCAFVAVLAIAAPVAAVAKEITPPAVPGILTPPAGSQPYLIAHAVGTQNYVCLPDGAAAKWVLFDPQASLFDDEGTLIGTHFLSPNPAEIGTPARATWQHSLDASAAWAFKVQESDDPQFVAPGAIKWFLLQVAGTQFGPDAGDRYAKAKFIQRVNTSAGVAPTTSCTTAAEVGKTILVPYTADYVFYD